MFRTMRIVFVKEAQDLLRDRRSLVFLLVAPLLMPILSFAGGAFVLWQAMCQAGEGLPVAVVNGEQLPALVAGLDERRLLHLVTTPSDLEGALQSGELVAVLQIPPDASERLRAEEPLTLTLTSSRSGWISDFAVGSVRYALRDYRDQVLEERLARHGLDRAWMNPIRLEQESAAPTGVTAAPVVAGEAASSSMSGAILSLAIALWALTGGLSVVAHMTVGEKEHRTMEALLLTPSSRVGIVLGKIAFSIIVSAVTAGLWSLDSLAYMLLFSIIPADPGDLTAPLIPQGVGVGLAMGSQWEGLGLAVVWLVLLLLPLTIMANGFVAAVCTFAKNYRESNLFLALFQLLIPGLALLAAFGVGATPSAAVYALPVVGVVVAVRDLFGGGVAPGMLALAWGAAVVYAAGTVLLAAYVFSREWALMRGV